MAKKKTIEEAVPAEVNPEEPPVVEEVVTAEVKPKEKVAKVMAVKGDQYEPFQRVRLPQGEAKPVVLTDWVKCQIAAGILKEV